MSKLQGQALQPHPNAIPKNNRNSTYKIWVKRIRLGQSLTPINSNWRDDKSGRFYLGGFDSHDHPKKL